MMEFAAGFGIVLAVALLTFLVHLIGFALLDRRPPPR